ncbi:MAG: sporulation integral membrane protein YlbJ [Syntrophomonadaceae bacterium]|nr:sporulation integral membrane protein YlbJ [Syntrophomonadaceae bacterium]
MLSIFMLINPRETVDAAGYGFKLWYSVIVPALLPFFIAAELLVSLGLAQFLGVLLEPIMRPLFRLPGCASLVVAMGFTSGFPVGAILTKRLYDEELINPSEAERLVSFTNNSSPLFIIGAVGVGMFNSPTLGCLLALSHYLANLGVGLVWGLTSNKTWDRKRSSLAQLFSRAFKTLAQHQQGSLPPGQLLSNAVKNSITNILSIAGFIILFSVLTRMLAVWGIMHYIALLWAQVLFFLKLPYEAAYGIAMGMFEITIGCQAIAASSGLSILNQMLAVSMVMAFSGFSIIAQVMGVLAGMPVRLSFYLKSRLLQIGFSMLTTWTAYRLFCSQGVVFTIGIPIEKVLYSLNAWHMSLYCMAASLLIIAIMMIFSLYRSVK